MKITLSLILCIVLNNLCYSQVDYSKHWANSGWKYSSDSNSIIDITKKVINETDLTYLLESTYPNYSEEKKIIPLYGLLGEGFNKIEIIFTKIEKSKQDFSLYIIKGKTKLDGKITDFKGNITFENATAYIPKDNPTKIVLIGSYKLAESTTEKNSGTYIGKIKMILSTKNIYANDILFDMDLQYEDDAVRGFVGVRKNNENGISQSCIWGFLRFPHQYAYRFDMGAGEEIINIKYAKPWFDYSKQEWDNIINGQNNDFYLHYDNKDKGIPTSNKEYIKPNETDWYKLNGDELKNIVIKQLKLNPNKIAQELVVQKELPNNLNETVIVIPENENEISEDDAELFYELTSHIIIINSITGEIKNYYSESSKTNNWVSDAIKLTKILIDTASYIVTDDNRAFGIRVFYYGMSRANPYSNETISLFIKFENKLKNILKNYDVEDYGGEWDTNCDGEFIGEKKTLVIMNNKTNGHYDILVRNKITETKNFETKNGDCDYKEKVTTIKTVLKFNGEEYKENNCTFLPITVFVNDSDSGTNIRQEPNGNIILKLKEQSDYFALTITEANNEWFKVIKAIGIEENNIEIPGREGWVHSSVIGVSTRRDIELLDAPNGTKTGTVGQEISVRIKDKCSDWVKIEYNGLSGWVKSKWLCGSPVTTCP